MHFLHRIKILLPVIVCLKFGTFVQGNEPKNADKCTHGGILSGVFLNAGVRPRNDTIFSEITSMEDCIEKCCKINKCDLAMKIGKVCHAVRCQDDDSCQISHRHQGSKVRAMIAFITKGEEIQSKPQTKPTKAASKFSATANKHQSTVNKRPTIPLIPGSPKANTKAVNTIRTLQIPRKESQGLSNVVDAAFSLDSGSGAADETNEEEDQPASTEGESDNDDDDDDDDGDSGSTSISSGESSGSARGSTRDEMNSKDVKIASRSEDNYVLPNVVKINSKLPSASRSAIPMSSEQVGMNLGLPLITYSHEDSSNNERDEKGQDEVSYDEDDEDDDSGDDDDDDADDDDDDDESPFKSRTELVSNRNTPTKGPSQRKLATAKSSAYQTTKTHVLTGLKHKTKPSEITVRGNRQSNRSDKLVSKLTKPHEKTHFSFGNEGNKQATVVHADNHKDIADAKRGHDYRSMEANRAVMSKVDADNKLNQVTRKLTDEKPKWFREKDSSTGKVGKDFNDVTRAVIMKRKGKSDATANTKVVAQEVKSKKTALTANPQQLTKSSYKETRLQKELSTLFAKDTTKINRNPFINPSKKSSFESVKKLQEQRDKKRHRSKGHPSSLYQILNIPRETAKCKRGVTIHGATLRGGILAGDFKTIGIVDNQHTCVSSCCKNKRCDVALMLGKECFNVKCYSSNLCGLAPATAIFDEVTPIITYVRGHIQKRSAEDQDEQVDEQLVDEPADEHTQLLKWLKIFI